MQLECEQKINLKYFCHRTIKPVIFQLTTKSTGLIIRFSSLKQAVSQGATMNLDAAPAKADGGDPSDRNTAKGCKL